MERHRRGEGQAALAHFRERHGEQAYKLMRRLVRYRWKRAKE